MKTSSEPIDDCSIRIQASFSPEEVRQEYDHTFAIYAKSARVKGFRPGKAPKEMVARLYQKEIIKSTCEVLRSRGLSEAAKNTKRIILGESDFKEDPFQQDHAFSASLTAHVEPQLDSLPEIKGLSLECPLPETPLDARINAEMLAHRAQLGKFEDADATHILQANDMAAVSFDATLDGRPLAQVDPNAKELSHSDEMWLVLDPRYAVIPAFVPALIGLKIGDTKNVTTSFDNKYVSPSLRGKLIQFSLQVRKTRRHLPAPLDEAFFHHFGVRDEADMREKIAAALEKADAAHIEHANRIAIVNLLLKNHVPTPATRIARLKHLAFYFVASNLARSRMPIDQLQTRLAEMQPAITACATRLAALQTLLLAIARAGNMTAPREKIDARLKQAANNAGYPHAREWARHIEFDPALLADCIHENTLAEKIIRLIQENATFTGPGKALAAKHYAAKPDPLGPDFNRLFTTIFDTLPQTLFQPRKPQENQPKK